MRTHKILIVDDNPDMLDIMGSYIESFGFEYDKSKDGLAAIENLKNGDFTIVITDMIMPNMDGMQLLKYIRENYPKIGVIVITGYGDSFSYTDVIRAGASDFMAKPINLNEFEAKLSRLVRELNLFHQLERQSIFDGLTDLYNRRYFDSAVLMEAQRAERQDYHVFLQLLDVDNLKGFNDKAGHQGGDMLLKEVGKILQQSIRGNVDWAFRYGGDEFGVVFTQIELKQIVNVAKRILKKFSQKNFEGTGISIGIAAFVRHNEKSWNEDIVDLVSRADKALYKAKNLGKNQMILDDNL
ncbi:MAG TPA: diguanylate cyclase [Syntrophales bacterium]|nr:diguanylate cyclase [Syntrophales bacterium]